VSGPGALADAVAHFRRRVLQDALNEACASYWLKRAEDFERVGTPECAEVGRACRHRAELSLIGGTWPEVDDVLSEVGDAS
jgi:hypothetical protein